MTTALRSLAVLCAATALIPATAQAGFYNGEQPDAYQYRNDAAAPQQGAIYQPQAQPYVSTYYPPANQAPPPAPMQQMAPPPMQASASADGGYPYAPPVPPLNRVNVQTVPSPDYMASNAPPPMAPAPAFAPMNAAPPPVQPNYAFAMVNPGDPPAPPQQMGMPEPQPTMYAANDMQQQPMQQQAAPVYPMTAPYAPPPAAPYTGAATNDVYANYYGVDPRVQAGEERKSRRRSRRSGDLATHTNVEGAFQFSNYHYHEPGLAVTNDGLKYGLNLTGTWAFPDNGVFTSTKDNWFLTGDVRFAYGLVDYEGSGTQKDNSDYLWDFRVMGGHDFSFRNFLVAPYVGVGYRFLYNDGRGTTSTNAVGYRRESQYVYLPIGATTRFSLFNDGSRFSLNGEYDQFLFGNQFSFLSDAGDPDDIENNQKYGFGLRGSLMYENAGWSVGPFVNYWNIDKSNVSCNTNRCGQEPNNLTLEYGLRVGYQFYSE